MKPVLLSTSLVALLFASSLIGCKKSSDNTDPVTPVVPISGTDTGMRYTARAICDHAGNDADLTSTGWTKTFEDNFDAGLANWTAYTGANATSHLQFYKESNVTVQGGMAQITTKRESTSTTLDGGATSYSFSSGLMQSKTMFSANETTPRVRIAARIKLPSGYGLQPNFTTTGNDYPKNGQITILQANRFERNFYATNYAYGTTNANAVRNAFGYITADADLTTCYHVYEMEWTKNTLSYYLDGRLVEQKSSGGYIPSLFGKQHRLSLFVVISSDVITRPQIATGTMLVDWVKVFTSK